MLHLVSQSPTNGSALSSCLRMLDENSAVVLLGDGVYAAVAGHIDVASLASGVHVFALDRDVSARGIQRFINTQIEVIDETTLVQLTVEHESSHSWF